MMDYMREGGWAMWAILISAIAVVVLASIRSPKARPRILLAGCILAIIQAILGMATGMVAVASHYDRFDDKAGSIAGGLAELANNGTFGGGVALVLGIAALVTYQRIAEKS